MQRAIITGGAGFVGSNLTRRLQRLHPEADLLVVDDIRGGHFENLTEPRPDDEDPYRGRFDARAVGAIDWSGLLKSRPTDVVYHLASITDTTVTDQALMMRDNVEAFERLVPACVATGTRLVWVSSAATYGTEANGATAAHRPFELEDAGRPANVYGFSKWIMENVHRRVRASHPEFHIVGLRYFNVFGPGEGYKGKMASMIYQLTQQVLEGKRPRIFHDGSQARDQVAVQDVVAATIAAASDDARPGIYNVGSGRTTSFNAIVDAINLALGTSHKPDYFENPFSFYQDYTCADLTDSLSGLPWRPEHDPEAAIAHYVRWLAAGRSASQADELVQAIRSS